MEERERARQRARQRERERERQGDREGAFVHHPKGCKGRGTSDRSGQDRALPLFRAHGSEAPASGKSA